MTPSETETLKMFDESWNKERRVEGAGNDLHFNDGFLEKGYEEGEEDTYSPDAIKQFLLTQLRAARSDERKQAYEEILAMNVPAFWEKTSLHGQAFIDCKFLIAGRIESARKA